MGWPQPEATLAKEPVTASQVGIFFQNYWGLGEPVLLEIGGGKKKSGFFSLASDCWFVGYFSRAGT